MLTHHAHLVRGATHEEIAATITTLKVTYALMYYAPVQWGIDDSRALIEEVSRTDGAGRPRAFVIETNTITVEAQNALLKLLEEPPVGVVFFFYLPKEAALLPTLRSRFLITESDAGTVQVTNFATDWLALGVGAQLAEIESRLKKKDLVWLEWFKNEALAALYASRTTVPSEVAKRLQYALLTLGTRGASNKMLLEEVALLLTAHARTLVSSPHKTR